MSMGQFHSMPPTVSSNMSSNLYSQLEQRFSNWALMQSAIQAVIVVGSRARVEHPADKWSDLDLVVFATNTASYLNNATWLDAFGQVRITVSNSFGKNDREWLALYADGSKLDVAFLTIEPATRTLQEMFDAFPYPFVLQRGVRVLLDKTNALADLRLPEIDTPQPTTQTEFTGLINHMLLDALKTVKFIRRNDLWRAKQMCDGDLKQQLLVILEWHAMMQDRNREVWYDGRFLDEWADRRALAVLPQTFATYHALDIGRALLETYRLFEWLAQETAQKLGYAYPVETSRYVASQLQAILFE